VVVRNTRWAINGPFRHWRRDTRLAVALQLLVEGRRHYPIGLARRVLVVDRAPAQEAVALGR